MNRTVKYERRDWVVTTVLLVAAMALRIPFRSQLAYHGDSAEFALAIREYNVALSQPHAPGYFLYVMLGRAVNLFVGDPNASLVWLSVIFGSALVAALYLLGVTMFGRRTGAAAALFAMSSPQTWFHSEVALTYAVDAFLVCVMVLWCWRAMRRGGTWCDAVMLGVLLAMIGGVRQQTVIGLSPLVIFTFWKFQKQRVAKPVLAAVAALVLGLAWFVPMVAMSGGLPLYLEIVRRHAANNALVTFAGAGWEALVQNIFFVGVSWWNGLLLGVMLPAGALLYRMLAMETERKRRWDAEHALALQTLAVWIVPMLLLGTAIGFTSQVGYVLNYLPGLLLLAGVVVAEFRKQWLFVEVTVIVCAVNAWAFLAWPRSWDRVFFGAGLAARSIQEHDAQLAKTVGIARSRYNPADAIVCHAEYYMFGFRHFQLYLPEFEHYQMWRDPTMASPVGRPMWRARGGQLESIVGIDFSGKKTVLLVVPPSWTLDIFKPYFDLGGVRPVSGAAGTLYTLPAHSVPE